MIEQKTIRLLPQDEQANSLPLVENVPRRGRIEGSQEPTARAVGIKSTDGLETRAHCEDPEFCKGASVTW